MVTYGQEVLHGDHKAGVADEPVPQAEYVPDRLHQHAATKQHKVKTGNQVSEAEDVDPRGAGDEDEAQHQPEEVAENKHLHHVQVAPEDKIKRKTSTLSVPIGEFRDTEGAVMDLCRNVFK